ncbi:hypothetical protein K474DRAFT_1694672 [Panus rudis PR-1116 ss-1]|nr:hypothetical protein K474DRAFT_1694672 [Panus rudis PR-1116 ss-1]
MTTSSPPPETTTTSTTNVEQEPDAPHLPPRPSEEGERPAHTTTGLNPTADASATAATTPENEAEQLSPEVAALKAMFPEFDAIILQSVLESVNNNQERAIDVLLGMSDPSYVSAHHPEAPSAQTAAGPTDIDTSLDEQLARQLALEDEEEQRRGRRHATGQNWPRRGAGVPPGTEQEQGQYEARTTTNAQQSGYVTGNERGDFQELQETVNRFAESGKRTFSSIVSKVKSKINDFEQSGGFSNVVNTISGNARPQSQQTQSQQQPQSQSYVAPSPSSPTRGVDRHTATQVYGAGILPRSAHGDSEWTGVTRNWKGETPVTSPGVQEVAGYDVGDSAPYATGSTKPSSPPSSPPVTQTSRPTSPAVNEIPKPPATQSGSPVNPAKVGLLPKRPVSLLGSQPGSAASTKPRDESDDELEYAENPFEDGKH